MCDEGDAVRERMRRQYYCDFCRKSGASRSAMALHEAHCTMNPLRKCRLCALAQNGQPDPVATHIPAIISGLDALRGACNGCPACMLAALRQDTTHGENEWGIVSFDYKKEVKKLFAQLNEDSDVY